MRKVGLSILGLALGVSGMTLWLASATAVAQTGECGFSGGDPEAGDIVFHQTCVACHGEDGKGVMPGIPDFTAKGGALSKSHEALAEHIANGFEGSGGPLAMPARGGNPDLSEQDLRDVHAYLHQRFGCG